MTFECIGCGADKVTEVLELDPQPPSNRYLSDRDEACETHRIALGVCTCCGLGQLIDPMPPDVVRSHFDWITYNEPEGHLDDLVQVLAGKVGLSGETRIVGVTYKDDSTLARFNRMGVGDTYRLKQSEDLAISNPLASLETIQDALSPDVAAKLSSRIGQADVLLVRHILEHAHDPRRLLEACRVLCRPGGVMVFEVPDCRKVLEGNDHCFLWEEHISYFTPATLRGFLESNGFADIDVRIYPYPMEDSLIAIVGNVRSGRRVSDTHVAGEIARLKNFAGTFSSRGSRIRQYLQSLRKEGKRVALFGAGHLAAKFANFYDLSDSLVGIIDDNANKLGRYLPGSKLPIIGSDCLDKGEIDLCLLTLNPESEQKVRKARAGYLAKGGQFRSIFSASQNSIDQDIGHGRA